jgi:hypothetical protein
MALFSVGVAIGILIAAIIVSIVFVAVYFSKKDKLTMPWELGARKA